MSIPMKDSRQLTPQESLDSLRFAEFLGRDRCPLSDAIAERGFHVAPIHFVLSDHNESYEVALSQRIEDVLSQSVSGASRESCLLLLEGAQGLSVEEREWVESIANSVVDRTISPESDEIAQALLSNYYIVLQRLAVYVSKQAEMGRELTIACKLIDSYPAPDPGDEVAYEEAAARFQALFNQEEVGTEPVQEAISAFIDFVGAHSKQNSSARDRRMVEDIEGIYDGSSQVIVCIGAAHAVVPFLMQDSYSVSKEYVALPTRVVAMLDESERHAFPHGGCVAATMHLAHQGCLTDEDMLRFFASETMAQTHRMYSLNILPDSQRAYHLASYLADRISMHLDLDEINAAMERARGRGLLDRAFVQCLGDELWALAEATPAYHQLFTLFDSYARSVFAQHVRARTTPSSS